jgi:uncharacterized protein YcaQ
LIGRLDCKAHRAAARLEVKSVHIEHPLAEDFPELMVAALQSFAEFNGCRQIDIADARYADIARRLQSPTTACLT